MNQLIKDMMSEDTNKEKITSSPHPYLLLAFGSQYLRCPENWIPQVCNISFQIELLPGITTKTTVENLN